MASWPSVSSLSLPSYDMGDDPYRPIISTEFEANYVQKRAASTRTRAMFDLSWSKLPELQASFLRTWVHSMGAGMFGYTHPVTAAVHTCTIVENSLKTAIISPGFRAVRIRLEEV